MTSLQGLETMQINTVNSITVMLQTEFRQTKWPFVLHSFSKVRVSITRNSKQKPSKSTKHKK